MVNGWKVAFFIMLSLFIICGVIAIATFMYGINLIKKEERCAASCEQRGADSYIYDESIEYCQCQKNGEEMKWGELIK